MILRAQTVVTLNGPPLQDGAVAVNGGRIAAVGPWEEVAREHGGEVLDLGAQVLLPGLINAHCHLDYSTLRDSINPPKSFTHWIGRINAIKRQMKDEHYLQAIALGFEELRKWGTTTVCNMEALPELLPKLPPPPLRTWWCVELIDLDKRMAIRTRVENAISLFQKLRGLQGWLGGFGLNPHAPYTASPDLFRYCQVCEMQSDLLLTTHIAESADEEAMFARGEGALFDIFKKLGRSMDDCGHHSSFSQAVRSGLIGPGWLLAHANELDEPDFALIAATPGDWHIVHCPQSHAYFQHRPFAWKRLEALGVNLSLGTDSLASNDKLNLFAEMRTARQAAPWLTSETLLKMVTTHPAKALRKAGELGELRPGAHADLIALPFAGAAPEVYDAIIENQDPIKWMMLDGKIC